MLKCLIKKSDNSVLWRQNSPRHRPSAMVQAYIRMYGGRERDFIEYDVPPEDAINMRGCKSVRWNPTMEVLSISHYTPVEIEAAAYAAELEQMQDAMIQKQIEIDMGAKLGFDTTSDEEDMDELSKKHKKLKEKKDKKD